MTCKCGVQITSLNSQRNGNLDTCLQCAIASASKLRYVLKRKDQLIAEEIVCQTHYREDLSAGGAMSPLEDREKRNGYVQTITPYTGEHDCLTCMEEADQQAESAEGARV
jgi:hypothetical protein